MTPSLYPLLVQLLIAKLEKGSKQMPAEEKKKIMKVLINLLTSKKSPWIAISVWRAWV